MKNEARASRDLAIEEAKQTLEFVVRDLRRISAVSEGCEALVALECLELSRQLRSKLATFQAACDNWQGARSLNHAKT